MPRLTRKFRVSLPLLPLLPLLLIALVAGAGEFRKGTAIAAVVATGEVEEAAAATGE